ncbi:MAG: RdgB/HAM1 family non-canonical purine NTP pyrophosphatase [Clostridiales Family XIII bacterium]|jgi:XTP/dITP diphosphohydrolase|nr:RdgB/HAM1 family non-canonical purine NTP pyrophosphatase [Clostridiales Family XIII bacterium]
MEILLATKNKHKISEIKRILKDKDINFLSLNDVDFTEKMPEEVGKTFKENARIKAEFIAKKTGKIALSDDSGLCVNYLDGRPGIYSARYAKKGTDKANINKVLSELKGIPYEKRTAYFIAIICIAYPNGKVEFCEGKTYGHILEKKQGENGFGYDLIFEPIEYKGQSFAEITVEEKNKISHRGRALVQVKLN